MVIDMTNREKLIEQGYEDLVVFENPSFDKAIIGVSYDDRVVYDYDLMVEAAMEEEGWTAEDAIDWIEFNTLRSLGYVEGSPIVIYSKLEE